MTDVKRRQMAADIAKMIIDTLGDGAPGLVVVVIANESEHQEGRIELDAALRGSAAYTEAGAANLSDFGKRITEHIRAAAAEIDGGTVKLIDRPDIGIPGPRGQS